MIAAREADLVHDRHRFGIDFGIDGDIRFISHNDSMRLFARACARSGLPLCFSGRFNPRPRVSLPFPRPVGQASDADRVLVDLVCPLDEREVMDRLSKQMPDGIALKRSIRLQSNDSCRPTWVRYRVDVAPSDHAAACKSADALLGSEHILTRRIRHKDSVVRVVDIRPFIDAVRVERDAVHVFAFVKPSGSASPVEVCKAIGITPEAANHLVRRVEIRWLRNPQPQPTSPPSGADPHRSQVRPESDAEIVVQRPDVNRQPM